MKYLTGMVSHTLAIGDTAYRVVCEIMLTCGFTFITAVARIGITIIAISRCMTTKPVGAGARVAK